MAGNTFGNVFQITTFGESHGKSMGVIIDGCPAGLTINKDLIAEELARRKPGQSKLTSQRKENEAFEIQSGVLNGETIGTPIAINIPNKDTRSRDYERFKNVYRPSHADYTYEQKYGIRDHLGGGRASARETANWVAAGAIAKMLLNAQGIFIKAYVDQIGKVQLEKSYQELNLEHREANAVRCPDEASAQQMIDEIETARSDKDSIGGSIVSIIKNPPTGLGEPVFHKLEADLAQAMMSINASKGFEIGSGFDAPYMRGSLHNDEFIADNGALSTASNSSGGVQGGISNGEDVYCRTAFKPVATIAQTQNTVDQEGNTVELEGKGRHDPCVVPRAVPIVEAMTALVIADHLLLKRLNKLD